MLANYLSNVLAWLVKLCRHVGQQCTCPMYWRGWSNCADMLANYLSNVLAWLVKLCRHVGQLLVQCIGVAGQTVPTCWPTTCPMYWRGWSNCADMLANFLSNVLAWLVKLCRHVGQLLVQCIGVAGQTVPTCWPTSCPMYWRGWSNCADMLANCLSNVLAWLVKLCRHVGQLLVQCIGVAGQTVPTCWPTSCPMYWRGWSNCADMLANFLSNVLAWLVKLCDMLDLSNVLAWLVKLCRHVGQLLVQCIGVAGQTVPTCWPTTCPMYWRGWSNCADMLANFLSNVLAWLVKLCRHVGQLVLVQCADIANFLSNVLAGQTVPTCWPTTCPMYWRGWSNCADMLANFLSNVLLVKLCRHVGQLLVQCIGVAGQTVPTCWPTSCPMYWRAGKLCRHVGQLLVQCIGVAGQTVPTCWPTTCPMYWRGWSNCADMLANFLSNVLAWLVKLCRHVGQLLVQCIGVTGQTVPTCWPTSCPMYWRGWSNCADMLANFLSNVLAWLVKLCRHVGQLLVQCIGVAGQTVPTCWPTSCPMYWRGWSNCADMLANFLSNVLAWLVKLCRHVGQLHCTGCLSNVLAWLVKLCRHVGQLLVQCIGVAGQTVPTCWPTSCPMYWRGWSNCADMLANFLSNVLAWRDWSNCADMLANFLSNVLAWLVKLCRHVGQLLVQCIGVAGQTVPTCWPTSCPMYWRGWSNCADMLANFLSNVLAWLVKLCRHVGQLLVQCIGVAGQTVPTCWPTSCPMYWRGWSNCADMLANYLSNVLAWLVKLCRHVGQLLVQCIGVAGQTVPTCWPTSCPMYWRGWSNCADMLANFLSNVLAWLVKLCRHVGQLLVQCIGVAGQTVRRHVGQLPTCPMYWRGWSNCADMLANCLSNVLAWLVKLCRHVGQLLVQCIGVAGQTVPTCWPTSCPMYWRGWSNCADMLANYLSNVLLWLVKLCRHVGQLLVQCIGVAGQTVPTCWSTTCQCIGVTGQTVPTCWPTVLSNVLACPMYCWSNCADMLANFLSNVLAWLVKLCRHVGQLLVQCIGVAGQTVPTCWPTSCPMYWRGWSNCADMLANFLSNVLAWLVKLCRHVGQLLVQCIGVTGQTVPTCWPTSCPMYWRGWSNCADMLANFLSNVLAWLVKLCRHVGQLLVQCIGVAGQTVPTCWPTSCPMYWRGWSNCADMLANFLSNVLAWLVKLCRHVGQLLVQCIGVAGQTVPANYLLAVTGQTVPTCCPMYWRGWSNCADMLANFLSNVLAWLVKLCRHVGQLLVQCIGVAGQTVPTCWPTSCPMYWRGWSNCADMLANYLSNVLAWLVKLCRHVGQLLVQCIGVAGQTVPTCWPTSCPMYWRGWSNCADMLANYLSNVLAWLVKLCRHVGQLLVQCIGVAGQTVPTCWPTSCPMYWRGWSNCADMLANFLSNVLAWLVKLCRHVGQLLVQCIGVAGQTVPTCWPTSCPMYWRGWSNCADMLANYLSNVLP